MPFATQHVDASRGSSVARERASRPGLQSGSDPGVGEPPPAPPAPGTAEPGRPPAFLGGRRGGGGGDRQLPVGSGGRTRPEKVQPVARRSVGALAEQKARSPRDPYVCSLLIDRGEFGGLFLQKPLRLLAEKTVWVKNPQKQRRVCVCFMLLK